MAPTPTIAESSLFANRQKRVPMPTQTKSADAMRAQRKAMTVFDCLQEDIGCCVIGGDAQIRSHINPRPRTGHDDNANQQ